MPLLPRSPARAALKRPSLRIARLAMLVGAVASASARSTSVPIVDDNVRAVVVIPAQASAGEKLAASEIVGYVRRMTGVTLPVTLTDAPPDGPVIALSCRPGPELGDEGYALTCRGQRLSITGARDRSVLNGAYDLLERLGCRWLAPTFACYGGDAERVPPQARLRVTLDGDVVAKPRLRLRKLYVEEGLSHDATNLAQLVDWMAKARFNTLVIPTDYQGHGRVRWDAWRAGLTPQLRERDIDIEVGGHGYQNFLNAAMEGGKLFEQHPEWFAVAAGKRVPTPSRVFCTSNPQAVAYLTRNVVRYLADRPEITIFDFWPPDGARWCECEACTKLGPPEDRQARLVAEVMAAARAAGITTRFECIAYAAAINPPKHPPMDKSVLIDFCPINQSFERQIFAPESEANATYVTQFRTWRTGFAGEISIYSYYRKYAWRSLPVLIPHYVQRDLQWYAANGAQGISSYAEPGDWRTYELNHYALARLAWNPDANVDAIVADFAAARFGAKAEAVRHAYDALECIVRHGCNIPGTSLKSPVELSRYEEELAAAEREVESGGTSTAIAAMVASLEYARRDLALQRLRAERADPAQIAARAAELFAFCASHRGEGVFIARDDEARFVSAYTGVRPTPKARNERR